MIAENLAQDTRPVPSLLPLIRIDPRDRAGLEWARNRARFWVMALKRRCRYLRPGEPYNPEEAESLKALLALEAAADTLLEMSRGNNCNIPGGKLGKI